MKQAFLTVCIVFAIITGCTKNSATSTVNNGSSQLIPFAKGNTWIYADTYYDSTGAVTSTFDDTLGITMDSVINDTTWFGSGDSTFTQYPHVYYSNSNAYYEYYLNEPVQPAGIINASAIRLMNTAEDSIVFAIDSFRLTPASPLTLDKYVAYSQPYTVNGYGTIKNVDSSFSNYAPNYYTEFYIKPGLGLVERDRYKAIIYANNTVSYYKARTRSLTSYVLH